MLYRFLAKYPEHPPPHQFIEISLDEVARDLSKLMLSSLVLLKKRATVHVPQDKGIIKGNAQLNELNGQIMRLSHPKVRDHVLTKNMYN